MKGSRRHRKKDLTAEGMSLVFTNMSKPTKIGGKIYAIDEY